MSRGDFAITSRDVTVELGDFLEMCDVRSFVQRLTFSERFLKVPYANVLLYVSLFVSAMVRMLYKKFEPLNNREI